MRIREKFTRESKNMLDTFNRNGIIYYSENYVKWLEKQVTETTQIEENIKLDLIEYLNRKK